MLFGDTGRGRLNIAPQEEKKNVVITDVVKHIMNAEALSAFLKGATSEQRTALYAAIQNSSKELPKTPYHETLIQSYMQSVVHYMRSNSCDDAECVDVIGRFIVEYMDVLLASGT